MELYGSLTTKELKKKHSSRLVEEAETAVRAESMHSEVATGGLDWLGKAVAGSLGCPTFACR